MTMPALEYPTLPLSAVRVHKKEGGSKPRYTLTVKGQAFRPSARFWTSFSAIYGVSDSIFNYYSHKEVFERISQVRGDSTKSLRFCLDTKKNVALAISQGNKDVIQIDDVRRVRALREAEEAKYSEGVMQYVLQPKSDAGEFQIGPDGFKFKYVTEIPVDGYGNPQNYLSILRLRCTNLAIAYSPAFKSSINIGKEPVDALERAYSSFENDAGFERIRNRVLASQKTQASLHECHVLFKLLDKTSAEIVNKFETEMGALEQYGIADYNAVSLRSQRMLPINRRVNDLVNFATEITTHHVIPNPVRMAIHGWVGNTLNQDFDLEGSVLKATDFPALFAKVKKAS